MRRPRLRGVRITPSLVISIIALFVALSSTGIAATVVPLAKRALTADKAKVAADAQKLNGQTSAQIIATPGPATDAQTLNAQSAAQIAATPGPANSITGLLSIKSVGWSVQAIGLRTDARVDCDSGQKVVGGGYDQANGFANVTYNRPLLDGSGWLFTVSTAPGNIVPANGSVWIICSK